MVQAVPHRLRRMLITRIVATIGFMEGVTVGLTAVIVLFVLKYSQINVTRYTLSGINYISRVRRSPNQERLLRQDGNQICILQLQGFIFFGTDTSLKQIRQQLSQAAATRLVLDFRLVSGLDSSPVLSFLKLKQLAQQRSLTLVFTNLSKPILNQFQHEKLLTDAQAFPTLDEGITWCENKVLETSQFRRTLPLTSQLEVFIKSREDITTFLKYLAEINLAEGDYLFRQGDQLTGLYFFEYEQISTVRDSLEASAVQRFETLRAGIVGETDFYAQGAYTSAIADTSSTLHHLSTAALQRMQQEHPQLAGQ